MADNFFLTQDAEHPELLVCSNFGDSHLDYSCVKLFYTGENITPDFNFYDYAIGFDILSYQDRFYRVPLYRLHIHTEKDTKNRFDFSTDRNFCNFLYTNSTHASPEREKFFALLSTYKRVDSGGAFLNNIGKRVEDKLEWQGGYKFSIAFENSSKAGYTTEKIYDALLAGTVPIYWGNPNISEEFNGRRFINCHHYPSFEAVCEVVRQLDEDDAAFQQMLEEPWFSNESLGVPLTKDEQLLAFLRNIVEQDPEQAKRTVRYGWTQRLFHERKAAAKFSSSLLVRALRKIKNAVLRQR